MNSEVKTCRKCHSKYEIQSDDFSFYERMGVPAPILCPDCRFKRRAVWRNEISLYSRKCGLCQSSVISMYNPNSPYTIYCGKCWESDNWSAYDFAEEYNPNESFFDQLNRLLIKVPKKATYVSAHSKFGPNINSDYTNVAGGNKNCYLVFNTSGCEDTRYSRGLIKVRDSSDIYFGLEIENCYEDINIEESNGVLWGHNVVSCIDSSFLLNTSACQKCFGCVNLRNKSRHFLNEPLSDEEYNQKIDKIKGSYKETENFKKEFEKFTLNFPRRENTNWKSIDCEGSYLFESKNVKRSFEITNGENSRYLYSSKLIKDSYDVIGYGYESELLLECVGVGYSSKIISTYWAEGSQNVFYSYAIRNGNECFGCDGIKSGKFAILNKRYSEEEYYKIKNQIITELKSKNLFGLFMPPEISPFAYNETVAQDNLPLTKERALAEGFKWQDDIQMTTDKGTLKPEDIPDHIKDVQDSILNETLTCISCSRNYRLTEPELTFYRKMVIPLPRKCFYCRHRERIEKRGPMHTYPRHCAKCQKTIQTSYAPDRPEIVYCEQCYQQEVV